MQISRILVGMLLAIPMIVTPLNISSNNTISASAVGEVVPYASNVFSSKSATVNSTKCTAFCSLKNTGSVTITNILQKQNSNGVWYDYLTTDSGKTYTNVRSATHTYNYTISSSGKYRCKSIMKGTVSGYTETVTVYSGTYTK